MSKVEQNAQGWGQAECDGPRIWPRNVLVTGSQSQPHAKDPTSGDKTLCRGASSLGTSHSRSGKSAQGRQREDAKEGGIQSPSQDQANLGHLIHTPQQSYSILRPPASRLHYSGNDSQTPSLEIISLEGFDPSLSIEPGQDELKYLTRQVSLSHHYTTLIMMIFYR